MDWRDIPSLAALRAYEAAARTGSLSSAARELNVTHAAISQHVRTLETRFGQKLLARDGQRMVPTEAGASLAERLAEGFTTIAEGVREMDDISATRPLRIALTPFFAAHWLMPRIGSFWAAHPQIEVELLTSTQLVSLRRDEIDLAIRFGRGDWRGVEVEPFLGVALVAVAAPGHVARDIEALSDLAEHTLLIETLSRDETDHWLRAGGLDPEQARRREFTSPELTREAARAGLGVAILSRLTVEDDLAGGRLIVLAEQTDSRSGYFLLTRPGQRTEQLSAFIDWIRCEVRQPRATLSG